MNVRPIGFRFGAWANSALSLTPRQIATRISRRARQKLLYPWAGSLLFPKPEPLEGYSRPECSRAFNELESAGGRESGELLERAEQLAQWRFNLLNLSSESCFRAAIWDTPPEGNRLWLETLHYGEWALGLAHAFAVTNKEVYKRVLIELIQSWLDHNPLGKLPAWNPYPIARRLVYWSRLHFVLASDSGWKNFWREHLEPSLRRQASLLAANLEHDVPNNHLIADYRALAWVGLAFAHWPEAERLRFRGLDGLWGEMRRQVLPDGVHFERSISYHTMVLQDLLETWYLARCAETEIPEDVRPTLVKMLEFLVATRAPDGTWPMTNDSVPGYPIDPSEVLLAGAALFGCSEWGRSVSGNEGAYRRWFNRGGVDIPLENNRRVASPSVYRDAGYVVLRDGRGGFLFFDAGPMGPKQIPGHGHADALSFVLYGGGRPLIVDPGVFTYEEGSWRDHFRSTRAHNTVTVDGEDQCVFWGAFRVARPPRVRILDASECSALGESDGYTRLSKSVLHRRRISRVDAGVWHVEDSLTGEGMHHCALTFQASPGARCETGEDAAKLSWDDGQTLVIRCATEAGATRASVEEGWVSAGWNSKVKAPRLVFSWKQWASTRVRSVMEVV